MSKTEQAVPVEHASWRAIDQGEGPRGKPLGIHIVDWRGFPLFIVPGGSKENKQRAWLAAAAPDLLASLKELLAITDRNHHAWDRARAAIAKTEVPA